MKLSNTLLSVIGLSNARDHWKLPEDWNFCGPANIIDQSSRLFPDQSRIVGGGPADKGSWPFIVRLKFGRNYLCAGSLIDGETVITAAHCCDGFKYSDYEIFLNDHYYSKLDEKEVKVSLTKMEYHSAFSWNSFKNDICVLTLDRDVTNYLPDGNNFPCLPPINHSWKTNTVCYAAGWGLTKEWGSIATELQSVDIWTFDDEQCAKQQDHHAKEMICAGKIGGGQDACQGDSGGPLLCEIDGNVVLAGITSWGIGCARAGNPGEWSKVSNYISWLEPRLANGLTPLIAVSESTTTSTKTTTTEETAKTTETAALTSESTTPKSTTTISTTTTKPEKKPFTSSDKARIRRYCTSDTAESLAGYTEVNLSLDGKMKFDPKLRELTKCYIETKEKRLSKPSVTNIEFEASLLDAFGTRQVCNRVRQRKHHESPLPCWEACGNFYENFKQNSPSFPFSQKDRKRILFWSKACAKKVKAMMPFDE